MALSTVITSEEVNYLIYRYLLEAGIHKLRNLIHDIDINLILISISLPLLSF